MKLKQILTLIYVVLCVGWASQSLAQPQHKRPKWDYNYVFCYDISAVKQPTPTFFITPSDVLQGGTETIITPAAKLALGGGVNGRLLLHKRIELNVKVLVLDKGYAETHSELPSNTSLMPATTVIPSVYRKSINVLYASFPFSIRYNLIAKERWKIFTSLGLSQDIHLYKSAKRYERFGMSWVSSAGIELKVSDFHSITIEPNIRVATQPYSTPNFSTENQRVNIYEPYSVGFMLGINRLTRSKTCPN